MQRFGVFRRRLKSGLNFFPEPIQTAFLNQIFHPGTAAVFTVSVVALDGDNGDTGCNGIAAGNIKKRFTQDGVGFQFAMRHAKTAPYQDGVTFRLAIRGMGNKADVLRVNVHIIAGRDGDADLELARQIILAVEGFVFGLRRRIQFFTVKPDFRIRAGLGEQRLRQFIGQFLSLTMDRGAQWRWGSHHIAHEVATGSNGSDARLADSGNAFLQSAFED